MVGFIKGGVIAARPLQPWSDTEQNDITKRTPFSTPYYANAPEIIMGLNFLDLQAKVTIGMKATAEKIKPDGFTSRVGIWGDGETWGNDCTWLAIAPEDPNFRSGTHRLTRRSVKPNITKIPFAAFGSKPHVVVWLSGFQMASNQDWGVRVHATEIENDSFKLNVEPKRGAVLHQVLVSWVAFVSTPSMTSGSASTELTRSGSGCVKVVKEVEAVFDSELAAGACPKVLQGINWLEVDRNHPIRIKLRDPVAADNTKMKLTMVTWQDTIVHKVGVTYIAIVQTSIA